MTTTSPLNQHRPSPAGVYTATAGGIDSSEADREIACTLAPDENSILPLLIRRNRKLLEGAVARLAGDGIRSFLDLGAGPPIRLRDGTRLPMVHEVARDACCTPSPETRSSSVKPQVIYVDNDLLAVAHLAAATAGQQGVTVIKADLADPYSSEIGEVLRAWTADGEPVAIVLGLVLHYWRTAIGREIVGWYLDQLPPKSVAVITVAHLDEEMAAQRRELLPATPFFNHGQQSVREFFAGLTWRPMLSAEGGRHARIVGGVGTKR